MLLLASSPTPGRAPLPAPGNATRPDLRPILLRPAATEDYRSDKGDILDLVRRCIKERALEPKDIRLTIKSWRPEEHYRITSGFHDCDISKRRAYQLAAAVVGDAYVVKLGAVPTAEAQRALSEWRLDPNQDEDGFRHATVAFFRDNDVVFEIKAQLWVDAERQTCGNRSRSRMALLAMRHARSRVSPGQPSLDTGGHDPETVVEDSRPER